MSEQGYEGRFANWIVKSIPDMFPMYYGILGWSHFIEGEEEKIYFPDFGLYSKKSLKNICWVDVKSTQHIDMEGYNFRWNEDKPAESKGKEWYNLDIKKHGNYRYVARILGIPAYIVIFEGKSRDFSYWARIDKIEPELKSVYVLRSDGHNRSTTRNFIPLKKGDETFKEEIAKLNKIS